MLHISISAETLFYLGLLPVTNSLLTTWLVMLALAVFAYLAGRKLEMIPSGFQTVIEIVVGGLYDLFARMSGKFIKDLFPLLATLFIFIIAVNWSGLLPGVGTVGLYHSPDKIEFTPLFRAPAADVNMTLALALIAFFFIQYYGFRSAGLTYGKKFINLTNPIFFIVGILEIVSDISKIISFTFRLFGNIFAGEVLLAVIAYLIPFLVPLPFFALELFVGFIQALVFAMLTAAFISIAASHETPAQAGH